ncbi:Na+/H+ antiporter subunit E [Natronomonas amylolytica]|uniref:Na+/H+ antiporter subunit E n=1 Tax=Natronomonas amylolytica TaxID=3108498 RepID=UPI003008AFE3
MSITTRRWLVAGVLFGILWMFVRGAALTPRGLAGSFLFGLAVGMPVAYVFRRLYEEEVDLARTVTIVPYVLFYILAFSKEIVVANVDVAYRTLVPWSAIEPQVILIPLRVETALGVTTIANSITLTPGTVTMDHDPDENALYVHVIDGRDVDAVVEPIRDWEDYALRIFDEPLAPGDEAPEIRVHPPDYPPEPKNAADPMEHLANRGEEEATDE